MLWSEIVEEGVIAFEMKISIVLVNQNVGGPYPFSKIQDNAYIYHKTTQM